jgi:hypothetical protein
MLAWLRQGQADLPLINAGVQLCLVIGTAIRLLQPTKEMIMHAMVRTYSGTGAQQLFDVLEERKADVEATLRNVPGLVSYTLLRSGEGGLSVTVCKDKAGVDESLKAARDWIQKNAPNILANPPVITEGAVVVQIN